MVFCIFSALDRYRLFCYHKDNFGNNIGSFRNAVLREKEKNMKKKVLILSGSPRKNGNTDILCDEFMRGALEAGHDVTKVRVAEKNVGYCKACYACRDTGVCAVKDDMADILQMMIDCDVMVLASPIYFYSVDAQLKAVIDRSVARWTEVRDKELYYIVAAADSEIESSRITLDCFRGYADCIEGATEKGVICGMGVYEKGEIKDTPAMAEAYEMGRRV